MDTAYNTMDKDGNVTPTRQGNKIASGQVKLVAIKSIAILPSGSPKFVDLHRELTLMKGLGHTNVLGRC